MNKRPYSALTLTLFMVCFVVLPAHAQELAVLNRNSISATLMDGAETELDAEAAVGLISAFGLERIQGYAEAFLHIETGSDDIEYYIEEAWLRWQALDGLVLDVGRMKKPTGYMDFKSPAEFREATNPFAFGSSPFPSLSYPADLIELALYGSAWKVAASVMPMAPRVAELDPDSPWFPRDRFPSRLVTFYRTFSLNDILLDEPTAEGLAAYPSFQITGELALGSLELLSGVYRGMDPETAYRVKIMTTEGDAFKYDIFLEPDRSGMQAVFAGVAWTGANVRVYGELALSPARYFATVPTGFSAVYSLSLPSRTVDAAVGLNAYCSLLAMDVIIEARHLFLDPRIDVVRPALASLGAVYATRHWFDGKISASLLGALTPVIDDRGFPEKPGYALALSLGWHPSLETELSLTVPVFGGNPDSDLGRYSGMTRLAFSLDQKR